jgi:hypothetical protein
VENRVSRRFVYWLACILQVVTSLLPCILLQAVTSRLYKCTTLKKPLYQRHMIGKGGMWVVHGSKPLTFYSCSESRDCDTLIMNLLG